MRTAQELARDFLRRVHGLAGLVDHDAGRAGRLRVDFEDHGLGDPDDDVMLADEAEPAVANLHRGQEVSQVHPTVRVHLEAVSLRKVSQDAGHRAAEELDLFVVEEELAFVAAVRAELFAEISVRTAFLEHASPPLGGWYSPTAYQVSSSRSVGRSASSTIRRPSFSRRSSNARTSGFARLLRCTYAIVAPFVRSTAWSIARPDAPSSAYAARR